MRKSQLTNKENIPSLQQQHLIDEKNQKEEEAVWAYMKNMYKTHGESLMNRFRNVDPIRKAPAHVDENDKARAELLRSKAVGIAESKVAGQSSCTTNLNKGKQDDQGECSPMNATENVVPQNIPNS